MREVGTPVRKATSRPGASLEWAGWLWGGPGPGGCGLFVIGVHVNLVRTWSASSTSSSASVTVPPVSINSFTVNIGTTMSQLKALAAAGTKGATSLQVGVVLPDPAS